MIENNTQGSEIAELLSTDATSTQDLNEDSSSEEGSVLSNSMFSCAALQSNLLCETLSLPLG